VVKLPATYKRKSLSGTSYKSKTVRAEFSGDWLSGLPQSCQHPETFDIVATEIDNDGFDSMERCPEGYYGIADMLIPDGVTGTETNWDGTETRYVLKASAVRQVLRKADGADPCADIKEAPEGAKVPTADDMSEIKKLLKTKPADAVEKVDAGVTKPEFAQD
jgi:hypothetical protein